QTPQAAAADGETGGIDAKAGDRVRGAKEVQEELIGVQCLCDSSTSGSRHLAVKDRSYGSPIGVLLLCTLFPESEPFGLRSGDFCRRLLFCPQIQVPDRANRGAVVVVNKQRLIGRFVDEFGKVVEPIAT